MAGPDLAQQAWDSVRSAKCIAAHAAPTESNPYCDTARYEESLSKGMPRSGRDWRPMAGPEPAQQVWDSVRSAKCIATHAAPTESRPSRHSSIWGAPLVRGRGDSRGDWKHIAGPELAQQVWDFVRSTKCIAAHAAPTGSGRPLRRRSIWRAPLVRGRREAAGIGSDSLGPKVFSENFGAFLEALGV